MALAEHTLDVFTWADVLDDAFKNIMQKAEGTFHQHLKRLYDHTLPRLDRVRCFYEVVVPVLTLGTEELELDSCPRPYTTPLR